MGKMLKMWDMCLSKKKKRVGLSPKKKRKEESGSVANTLLLRTNNLAINFNQKKNNLAINQLQPATRHINKGKQKWKT